MASSTATRSRSGSANEAWARSRRAKARSIPRCIDWRATEHWPRFGARETGDLAAGGTASPPPGLRCWRAMPGSGRRSAAPWLASRRRSRRHRVPETGERDRFLSEVAARLDLPEPIARDALEELAGHLDDAAAALRAAGYAPDDANRRAVRELGDPRQLA